MEVKPQTVIRPLHKTGVGASRGDGTLPTIATSRPGAFGQTPSNSRVELSSVSPCVRFMLLMLTVVFLPEAPPVGSKNPRRFRVENSDRDEDEGGDGHHLWQGISEPNFDRRGHFRRSEHICLTFKQSRRLQAPAGLWGCRSRRMKLPRCTKVAFGPEHLQIARQ